MRVEHVVIGLGGLLAAAGVSLLQHARKAKAKADAVTRWPTTPGTIEAARIVAKRERSPGSSSNWWELDVSYSYEVAGQFYKGDLIGFLDVFYETETQARKAVEAYQVGTTVTVFHDPAAPEMAVLDTRPSAAVAGTAMLGGVLCALGLGAVALAVFLSAR